MLVENRMSCRTANPFINLNSISSILRWPNTQNDAKRLKGLPRLEKYINRRKMKRWRMSRKTRVFQMEGSGELRCIRYLGVLRWSKKRVMTLKGNLHGYSVSSVKTVPAPNKFYVQLNYCKIPFKTHLFFRTHSERILSPGVSVSVIPPHICFLTSSILDSLYKRENMLYMRVVEDQY